jgi:NAD(P)H-nitrite reductase large subunit
VGGSAAGMAAAHAIREKDARGTITVFSEESDVPYFRPLIPFLVSGRKQPSEVAIVGCGPYTGADITVQTGTRVASLDPATRSVVLEDGSAHGYEQILFATGSRPYIPSEIEGTEAEGVFALRTLADARRMAARVERTEHAVMLGGGLLNLKAAFALLERGVMVTLAVYSPEVLSQLMEPDDALLIRKALKDAGLSVMTGVAASGITADASGVTGVTLDNGSELPCQMVCIGKGVRPNVEYLDGSGVQVDGGIVADRYTGASLPGTYAAGDVAVTHEPVSGAPIMTALWTNAVEMGRCAGMNMAGIKSAYAGTFGILNATQVADVPFVAMGVVHTGQGDWEIHRKATATTFSKLVFDPEGTRLVGVIFVGNITNAGLYRYVIREKMDVARFKREIIDHRLHYGYFTR